MGHARPSILFLGEKGDRWGSKGKKGEGEAKKLTSVSLLYFSMEFTGSFELPFKNVESNFM